MKCCKRMLLACLIGCVLSSTVLAGPKELARAQTSVKVLREIVNAKDKRIPEALLDKAYAIAVIPEVVKAGLVFGGRYGRGLISVRTADGTWSNPSFISMTGGSVGFQAGVQASDVVLVFRTQRGVDNLVNGKFTLGADASVAAGPLGRTGSAATDQDSAEILSYARSRGLFAGIALDGSVLSIDHNANESVYGRDITPRQIFEGRIGKVPAQVVAFRDELEEQTAR
jgi:lipid-binding SYLF domain-containing protein